jgi:uncharacterized protein (DUF2164 family)
VQLGVAALWTRHRADHSRSAVRHPMRDKKSITISDDARTQAVAALRSYFAEHLDEEIGDLKAGLLLDFILTELGPTVYNQAIADARAFFEERSGDLAAVCYREEFPSAGRRRR